MRILEVEQRDDEKLVALTQFLLSRAEDENAKKEISIQAYLRMANNMNISLTADQLKNISQRPPLNNLIANVEGDGDTGRVIFKGADVEPDAMSVDQAQATVNNMAKRAAKNGL